MCGFKCACFLPACMQEAFLGPYTESLCVHLQSGGRELTSASLIVGPALSDSIAGPAATQHGLNTQER